MAKRTHIDKWAEGKNPLVVAYALSLFPLADLAAKWLRIVAHGEASTYLGRSPRLAEWFPFYAPDRSVVSSVLDNHMDRLVPDRSNADLLNGFFRWLEGLSREDAEALLRLELPDPAEAASWRAMAEAAARHVRENLEPFLRASVLTPRAPGLPPLPADLQFLLRVVVPSWLLLGRPFRASLEAARSGDRKALDVLLRLDPDLVHDRKVAAMLHRARHDGERAALHRMALALSGEPVVPTRKKLKYLAFGVLSVLSSQAGIPLDEPELRRLADALARLRSGDQSLRDLDLPESAEALSKAVRRGREELGRFVTIESLSWQAPAPAKPIEERGPKTPAVRKGAPQAVPKGRRPSGAKKRIPGRGTAPGRG